MDNEFETLVACAAASHEAGRLAEAEAAYRVALAVAPGHAGITQNLGVIAAAQGRYQCAIARFDAVIAKEPRHVSAHYNRAAALQSLGQTQEAIKYFQRASALDPGHYEAHRALGFLWLAEGNRDRALDHFARTYELRRGEDRSELANKSLTWTTRSKLAHDAEQFRFLAVRRRDSRRFENLARAYEAVAETTPEQAARLSDQHREALGEDYNAAINIRAAPESMPHAVAARADAEELTQRFESSQTGAVYFDGLLTEGTLQRLKSFLLESTIWHDFDHIGGFVASYLEDGLACPLLLQIADELRQTFPRLLGEHPLTQAWAFKGLRKSSTVDIHADDAAISVNFWVTPDDANLRPGSGGLIVDLIPAPDNWEIRDYDDDQKRVVAFLEQNPHDRLIVPYKENRAVLFKSRLFHRSDDPRFAEGYENHRINLTFLFGWHRPASVLSNRLDLAAGSNQG
jgi:tetratricopeptide (TPR) repeat protein